MVRRVGSVDAECARATLIIMMRRDAKSKRWKQFENCASNVNSANDKEENPHQTNSYFRHFFHHSPALVTACSPFYCVVVCFSTIIKIAKQPYACAFTSSVNSIFLWLHSWIYWLCSQIHFCIFSSIWIALLFRSS